MSNSVSLKRRKLFKFRVLSIFKLDVYTNKIREMMVFGIIEKKNFGNIITKTEIN